VPRIELATFIPTSRERCFELSLSVDAHSASMAESGERAIGGVTSGVMNLGDTVTWRARHFGIPFTMTSTIANTSRLRGLLMSRSLDHFVDGGTSIVSKSLMAAR
jgi:hypothetical protein